MFRRDVATRRIAAASAALASAAVLTVGGVASPARAESGLERAVGPIPRAIRAVLPTDPNLWGAYRLGGTPDLCLRGAIRCVDATIADMDARFQPLATSCHHNAVFSLLYLRVTQRYRVVATRPGFLIDPANVNRQDVDFARLYTWAYDKWHGDRPVTVPPIWRLAFAAADEELISGTGDALMGMIGHIKRDLPFALWRVALGHREDHLAINDMLKKVYPSAGAELRDRFDPLITPDGRVPGTGELVVDAIATWRDQAWRDAQDLLAAPDAAAYNAVAMRIERAAWDYGQVVYLASKYALDAQDAARDAYCQQQRAAG